MKPESEDWTFHNIERLEEAIQCLYNTIIMDDRNAELRGQAIRAIDQMIVNLRGESAVSKIQAVPFSARLRESEYPALRNFGENLKNHFGGE